MTELTDIHEIRARMLDAIEAGESLLIRYNAGDQPGTIREIAPVEFRGANKVDADCYSSDSDQTFVLSELTIIDSTDLSLVDYEHDEDLDLELMEADADGVVHEESRAGFLARLWSSVKDAVVILLFLVGALTAGMILKALGL